MSPSARHIRLLADCLIKLPLREDLSFVGSTLPNETGDYELTFREDASGTKQKIYVPAQMLADTTTAQDTAKLLAYISARYVFLFRKSPSKPISEA